MHEDSNRAPLWKRVLQRMAIYGLLTIVGLYGVFYFAQTDLIFLTNTKMGTDPSARGWDYEAFALSVDGETTRGWYIPHPQARGVVLYSHGNDSNISTCLGPAKIFRELGFSVVLYDYGGYGESTGSPSESRVYKDARAVWHWVTDEKEIAPQKIVLWGPSFGGGATCELATHVQPAGVVLENTFSSMADAAFKDYPWFPGSLFIRHRFDNKSKVGNMDAPLLIIHSQGDRLYPFTQGELLFQRASEPKTFLEVAGDHGEGAIVSRDVYVDGVQHFLAQLGLGDAPPLT